MYKPYIIFGSAGIIFFIAGLIPFARFVILSIDDGSTKGHIQSLVIGSTLLIASFLSFALNVIADLIRINRILNEDILEQSKRHHFRADRLT